MRTRVIKMANEIIEKSFPELRKKCILFVILPFRFYALSLWIPPFGLIIISLRTKKIASSALTGLIAHELCHQERYRKMGLMGYLRFTFGYIFSKKNRIDEEHNTDRLTILKGYAHELYELSLVSQIDPLHKKIIDNYMSPEEIYNFAIEAGVWTEPNHIDKKK